MAFGQPAPQTDPYAQYRAGFVNIPQAPMAQAVAKPSFFGQGGAGRNIAGLIGDALLRLSGNQPIFTPLMAAMRQRQMELSTHEAEAQAESDRELNREKALHDYENPPGAPQGEYERALQEAGIVPGTPEYIQHMKNYVQMKENPPYFYTDPATGATQVIPRTMVPGTPAPAGVTFTPIGGPTPQASGGFPR